MIFVVKNTTGSPIEVADFGVTLPVGVNFSLVDTYQADSAEFQALIDSGDVVFVDDQGVERSQADSIAIKDGYANPIYETVPRKDEVADSEVNDLTTIVTWANVPNANITQSSITQHEAALNITESQISDLGAYITIGSDDQLGVQQIATRNTGLPGTPDPNTLYFLF